MTARRFRDMRLTEDEVSGWAWERWISIYDPAFPGDYDRLSDRAKRLLPLWREWGIRDLATTNAALTKRVAELDAMNSTLATKLSELELRFTRRVSELKSQLAWTPVSEGLPTEPGAYELEFRTTAKYQLKMYEDGQSFSWMLRDRPLASHATEFDEFRRIDLPEATHGCDCDTPTTVHDFACPMNRGES